MTDHAAGAQDRRLANAGDEWEDDRRALERLNEAMGVCAEMGHWTSYYLLLPDVVALRENLNGGDDAKE